MVADIDAIVGLQRAHTRPTETTWLFTSLQPPVAAGNNNGIAYGGCVSALALAAAYQTSSDVANGRLTLYSSLGHYLGPAFTTQCVTLHVEALRDTRSFCTRLVRATQEIDGKQRTCMVVTVDFVATLGDRTVFDFSSQPTLANIEHYSSLPSLEVQWRDTAHDIEPSAARRAQVDRSVAQTSRGVEYRFPRNSIWSHNIFGFLKERKHPQQHLPIEEQTATDWHRAHRAPKWGKHDDGVWPPSALSAHTCQLAFAMDAYMSYLPISFNKQTWSDMQAASSLDFALRFHTADLDSTRWHYREMRAVMAGEERGYDEARLWRERGDGRWSLVATMNQATVQRGKVAAKM